MNVIVVGCGRVGSELAHQLHRKGHTVTVMDRDAAAFENLPPDFRGRTVEGEVLSQEVLRRARIDQADALAAVTSSDSVNSVVAHVARTVYHVTNVVVRNYEPRAAAVQEVLGLQSISSSRWGARRLEEILSDTDVHSVFSAGNGEVRVYELIVTDAWDGRALGAMLGDYGARPVALTRGGAAVMPDESTRLTAGDVLHVGCTSETIGALRAHLSEGPREE